MTKKQSRTATEFNLFDEPTVTKLRKARPSRKMSDWEKEEKARKKRAQKEKEIDKKYKEQGREQLTMRFENKGSIDITIQNVISEEINKIIQEKD